MSGLQIGDVLIFDHGQPMRIVGHVDSQGNTEFLMVGMHDWNTYMVLHSLGTADEMRERFDAHKVEVIRKDKVQITRVL
jgi:hypothetical protein